MNGFLENITPALIDLLSAVITALCGCLIAFIHKKKKIMVNNDYINMLADTVEKCVRTTNQTFVEALKKENAFTKEAQEEAFNKTLTNIMSILTDDCIKYLNAITDDLNEYLRNAIESEVAWNKE